MGKLVDIFVEWAKQERRWPLLVPLALPAIVKFSQEYFQLSFREAVTHWSVLIAGGALLVVSSALYGLVRSGGFRERIPLGVSLAVVGVGAATAGTLQFRPASLPSDRLVVAIARVTAVSAGAREDADNLAYLFDQTLRDKQRAGLPVEVKRVNSEIAGVDERARRAAAISVARSRAGAAHVILWGDVRRDEGQLYVEPRLTVARPLAKELPEDRSLGRYTSEGPSHISFKRRLSTEIAETVGFVYGLALFNAGRWQEAAGIFEQSSSPASHLYHAMSLVTLFIDHFRRTGDRTSRLALLDSAGAELLDAYQALESGKDFDLASLSLIKLGEVLRLRGAWEPAIQLYEKADALARRERNAAREAAARVGLARTKLLGTRDLEGAVRDIEHAISLYERRDDTSALFNALDWKAAIQEGQGNLDGAIETLDRAFSLTKRLDDRGLLFYGYMDRAAIHQSTSRKHVEARAFSKAYRATDQATADYKQALAVAEALGWKGLADEMRGFLKRNSLRRQAIEDAERVSRAANAVGTGKAR